MVVVVELLLFFGAILGFAWWQIRLMRAQINDEGGSALAAPPRGVEREPAKE